MQTKEEWKITFGVTVFSSDDDQRVSAASPAKALKTFFEESPYQYSWKYAPKTEGKKTEHGDYILKEMNGKQEPVFYVEPAFFEDELEIDCSVSRAVVEVVDSSEEGKEDDMTFIKGESEDARKIKIHASNSLAKRNPHLDVVNNF